MDALMGLVCVPTPDVTLKSVDIDNVRHLPITTDCYLSFSHSHLKTVSLINAALNRRGIVTLFDEENADFIVQDLNYSSDEEGVQQKIKGNIENTRCMLCFITSDYRDIINDIARIKKCKYEFICGFEQLGPQKIIPVILQSSMKIKKDWKGELGFGLANVPFVDFSVVVEGTPLFESKVDDLLAKIREATSGDLIVLRASAAAERQKQLQSQRLKEKELELARHAEAAAIELAKQQKIKELEESRKKEEAWLQEKRDALLAAQNARLKEMNEAKRRAEDAEEKSRQQLAILKEKEREQEEARKQMLEADLQRKKELQNIKLLEKELKDVQKRGAEAELEIEKKMQLAKLKEQEEEEAKKRALSEAEKRLICQREEEEALQKESEAQAERETSLKLRMAREKEMEEARKKAAGFNCIGIHADEISSAEFPDKLEGVLNLKQWQAMQDLWKSHGKCCHQVGKSCFTWMFMFLGVLILLPVVLVVLMVDFRNTWSQLYWIFTFHALRPAFNDDEHLKDEFCREQELYPKDFVFNPHKIFQMFPPSDQNRWDYVVAIKVYYDAPPELNQDVHNIV